VFAGRLSYGWRWSLLAGISDQGLLVTALAVWAAAAALLVGFSAGRRGRGLGGVIGKSQPVPAQLGR
jgi:hypothetical protein